MSRKHNTKHRRSRSKYGKRPGRFTLPRQTNPILSDGKPAYGTKR